MKNLAFVSSLLAAFAAPALSQAQCPLSLAAAANYATASRAHSVAVGDFNADGRPDLAVANAVGNNVSILLGNAPPNAGTFQVAVNYPVVGRPQSVATGDFNADGRPDLAVTSALNNNVSILLGNGNGTFQAAVNYAVGSNPISVAVGHFNADSSPDLAVTNESSNNVSILLGNANGTFQVAVNYAVGTRPNSVAVGDFNADGSSDLAVTNFTGDSTSILLGNGGAAGTFQAAVNYAVGERPTFVALSDFNADGRTDLAVTNAVNNNVSILLGNANGTFQSPSNFGVGTTPFAVAAGDFNGDGQPDLAVANFGGDDVSILLGIVGGGGTFEVAVNYSVGSSPRFVAVGDFNADGRADLAVANFGSANVSVLLNTTSSSAVVSQQPVSVSICTTGTAAFSVTATGTGPLTYQWQWQPAGPSTAWAALANGINNNDQAIPTFNVSGASTPTMNVSPISGVGGNFRCIVTNACGSVTSNEATLTITTCGPVACALADVASDSLDTTRNPNNAIGSEDLDAFIAGFIADNAAIADVASDSLDTTFNPNGSVGSEDLDAFIASFIAGC